MEMRLSGYMRFHTDFSKRLPIANMLQLDLEFTDGHGDGPSIQLLSRRFISKFARFRKCFKHILGVYKAVAPIS